jgi:hypothetical protein
MAETCMENVLQGEIVPDDDLMQECGGNQAGSTARTG